VSDPRNERRSPSLVTGSDDDARLVARIEQTFRPAPLDEHGRVRFEARLRERLEAPRRMPISRLAPIAAGVVLAAAVGWALRATTPAPEASRTPVASGRLESQAAPSRVASPDEAQLTALPAEDQLTALPGEDQLTALDWEVLAGDTLASLREEDLPDDYAAIAAAFRIP
jgi:hypothetical protein